MRKDLTGMKFGRWTVLEYVGTNKHKKSVWKCKCECGTEREVSGDLLQRGKSTSCGCYHREISSMALKKDIKEQKFGKLLVLEEAGKRGRHITWKCLCDCGKEVIKEGTSLITGKATSCGCVKKGHRMSTTRFYKIWTGVKSRCNNPKKEEYYRYGGRGISYQPSWEEFNGFYQDMYESYITHTNIHGEKNTTLDRIDVNGDYTKDNCRWATPKEQCNNKRANHLVKVEGDLITIAQASEKYDIHYQTILGRIRKGKDIFGNMGDNK